MKRRTLSLLLASTLALALLTSCGSPASSNGSASSGSGSISAGGTSQSGSASSQDSSTSVSGSASQSDSSQEGSASTPGSDGSGSGSSAQLTLNRSDFSLFTVGATFRLKAGNVPQGTDVAWSSSDEAVASVSENGTVTYVSAGSATITANAGDLTAVCRVYCKPEQNSGSSNSGSSSSGSSSSGSGSSAPSQVDLAAFYTTVSGTYEFPSFMQLADKAIQDNLYPGLSDISTAQCLVYANQMSMNMGEFVLLQVTDAKDVDAAKAILQARIDGMADGGAWYPEPTRIWSECSKVVSNGSYIMMVVSEDYQSIVDDFNALF